MNKHACYVMSLVIGKITNTHINTEQLPLRELSTSELKAPTQPRLTAETLRLIRAPVAAARLLRSARRQDYVATSP